jgi:hypothetical protein
MEITLFEAQAIREFSEAYIAEFKKAIETQKVSRQSVSKGAFKSTVNNTGQLANSGEWNFTGATIEISVNSYIRYVLFGRGDNSKRPPITAIEEWMQEKGITGVSPFAIANSMAKKGNSIFQATGGQPNELLEGIPLDELLNELGEKLALNLANEAETKLLSQFINIEQLNIEL